MKIKIFEPIYENNSRLKLSNSTPLHLENKNPERRELQAYVEIFQNKLYDEDALTGIFSSKFEIKSLIPLDEFIRFSTAQSSVEAVHINPFPYLSYWSYNVWEQGEVAHPGLIAASQSLLDAVGIDIEIKKIPRHNKMNASFCNYWVGSAKVWREYVGEILIPINNFMDAEYQHPAVKEILKETIHTEKAPYLPFMIERLFSTWLSLSKIQYSSYSYTNEYIENTLCSNKFAKLLYIQMFDVVNFADNNDNFNDGLKKRMTDMCNLYQQYILDYYSIREHPHTGKVLKLN